MKSEEDLDNLFKKSMDDPANHRAFNEDDWDAFEQMLDAGKKRRGIVYWLPRASAIAAMLLLALGWWFFIKPAKVIDDNNTQAGVKPTITKPQTKQGANDDATKQPLKDTVANKQSVGDNLAVIPEKDTNWNKHSAKNLAAAKSKKDTIWNTQKTGDNLAADKRKQKKQLVGQQPSAPFASGPGSSVVGNDNLAKTKRDTATLNNAARIAGINSIDKRNGNLSNALANMVPSLDITMAHTSPDFKSQIDIPPAAVNTDKPAKKITKQGFGYRPQLAITALASSDVNGTSSFQGKMGSNYGALLSLGLTKKLTITSGVVYSSKPYNTSFANYNTAYVFKHEPSDVTADCKMLDIPINIGYQVFGNFRNKISVGTGFSSYIMLHEKYTYNYADGNNPAWPQTYTVPNSKGYYLSILNLNATYERKINSKFGLSVQPYMKVPLSGVGYSDLKLQSTGVAVGVTYNINAFRKP
ncbi:hypothetical protein AAFN85_19825 [Mucilaginibacter sp. CAU 1740]|uniref:hypothetical protein n=1 Tax=Mucilaginibacter sp. CAU 1740 TaxID=3140365 RepID=UPI00325C0A74